MQGFNMGRYVPPELEGRVSHNQASGKGHALGSRARKIGSGILTVRFEMPFAIWCSTCGIGKQNSLIGQGVRFNAEKKKVGAYYSTPIYSFRMKHTSCGGWIEIQTDPKNTAYVVHEGAQRRDYGEEKDGMRDGEIVIGTRTEEEKQRLESDPFAALEHKVGDQAVASIERSRIEQLYHANSVDWEDPGDANRRLRKTFRANRKRRACKAMEDEKVKTKFGIDLDLLDLTQIDHARVKAVDFRSSTDLAAVERIKAQPLFHKESQAIAQQQPRASKSTLNRHEVLRAQIQANTRISSDPFLRSTTSTSYSPPFIRAHGGRNSDSTIPPPNDSHQNQMKVAKRIPLVDYDSD